MFSNKEDTKSSILSPRAGGWRRALILLTIIGILALVLRLTFLLQIRTTPVFNFLAADTGDFEKFALEILRGDFLGRETIYFNPFYPFFLAGIYYVFGHHPFLTLITQAILDVGTCILLFLLSTRIFRDKWTGLVAAFIYAGYGLAIFYTGIMVGATFSTFLFVAAAYLALLSWQQDRRWLWLCAGVILGLGALLRPNILFVMPFLIIWLIFRQRDGLRKGTRLFRIALLLGGILLIILPFSFRHYLITGNISLPFGNGGFNFYVGNHHGAPGTYTYLKGISNSPSGQIKSSVLQAKKVMGDEVNLSQASTYWFGRGVLFIEKYPAEYLLLLGRKFLLFWNFQEIGQNIDYTFCRQFSSIISLPFFSFGIIAPFAWLGFIFALRRRPDDIFLPGIFLFSYMGSIVIFFVSARYRLPAVPFVIIFSSYGVSSLIRLCFPKIKKAIWLYLLLLIALFVCVNIDLSPINEKEYLSWSHNMLGNVYQEQKQPELAIREFKQALAIDPNNTISHNSLGNTYRDLGLPREAIFEYQQAIGINPNNATARNNLGVIYAELGRVEEASGQFQAALRTNPDFGEAHSNLAVYYFYFGEKIRLARYHAGLAETNGYQIPDRLREDLAPPALTEK